MKHLLIILFSFLSFTLTVDAQTAQLDLDNLTVAKSSRTSIDLNTYTATITIAGKEFIGGTSKSGSVWIKRISGPDAKNAGEPRKQYLGTRTNKMYKDSDGNMHSIWVNSKKTKAWYYVISDKTGFPSRVSLEPKV